MRKRRSLLGTLLLAATALAGCSDVTTPVRAPAAAPAAAALPSAAQANAGRWLVLLKEGADPAAEARSAAAAHAGKVHHVFEERELKAFAITLPQGAAEALRRNPRVAEVREDGVYTLHAPTTQTGATWGLDRVDQRDRPLNGSYVYAYSGAGVWVYLIDSGIRPTHGDFGGRASIGYDARPYDARGGLPYGRDCLGHGTHVAGTVGGTTYGVAKGVSLVGVRVTTECTTGYVESDLIAGIYWVRDQKVANPSRAMVANLSLGQPGSTTVDNAITTLISSGVTVVTSAGNSNANACNYSPARVAGALTVGATTSLDARASFSNYGSCLDLFAPGQDITSLSHSSDFGTALSSGTSMAAPHVSGVAALYLEENPGAAPATVHNALRSRATPGRVSNNGSGSVNLLLFSRTVIYVDIDGESYIHVPDDNDWDFHTWTAVVSGGRAPYTYQWEVSYPDAGQGWGGVGTNPSTTFGVMAADGDIELRVTVTSDDGAVAQGFLHVEVTGPGSGCSPEVIFC